jgi:hypothetical protein
MACEIISADGAVFVLWGRPTRGDIDLVVERVEQVASAAGGPIVFIARIPQDAPAPDAAVRTHLNRLMARFMRLCSSYHAVLEGGGFTSAIKRAILAGLFQFGFRSGTFFVHDTEHSVTSKLDGVARTRAQTILTLAAARGLLTAGAPAQTLVQH